MSLTKSWYTYEEASSKYGISIEILQQQVEQGLIRTEGEGGKVILLNCNDIEQELGLTPSL